MVKLFRRYTAYLKLLRGQCLNCQKPLRDDALTRYCSDECDFQYGASGY